MARGSHVEAADGEATPRGYRVQIASKVEGYACHHEMPVCESVAFSWLNSQDTLIYVETLEEVLADKLISLPASTKYIRNRDLWDIGWLRQRNTAVRADLVKKKIRDYRIPDYDQLLKDRIESIPTLITSKSFSDEMLRFLPTDVFDRTLGQEKFKQFLARSLTQQFVELHQALYSDPESRSEGGEFQM